MGGAPQGVMKSHFLAALTSGRSLSLQLRLFKDVFPRNELSGKPCPYFYLGGAFVNRFVRNVLLATSFCTAPGGLVSPNGASTGKLYTLGVLE